MAHLRDRGAVVAKEMSYAFESRSYFFGRDSGGTIPATR